MLPRRQISALPLALTLCLPGPAPAQRSSSRPSASPPHSVQLDYQLIRRGELEAWLQAAPAANPQRELRLRQLFIQVGCAGNDLWEEPVSGASGRNVLCELPAGAGAGEIFIGAHWDHVAVGAGVVDNWSGAALLPALYLSQAKTARRHTLVFVGFAAEERGELGSRALVKELRRQHAPVVAMVNMDSLGVGPTRIWGSRADPHLLADAASVLFSLGLRPSIVNVDRVGSTDSESFRLAGYPAITFHSLTQQTWAILHSPQDQYAAIRFGDYYDSYRGLAAYVAYLDRVLPLVPARRR